MRLDSPLWEAASPSSNRPPAVLEFPAETHRSSQTSVLTDTKARVKRPGGYISNRFDLCCDRNRNSQKSELTGKMTLDWHLKIRERWIWSIEWNHVINSALVCPLIIILSSPFDALVVMCSSSVLWVGLTQNKCSHYDDGICHPV